MLRSERRRASKAAPPPPPSTERRCIIEAGGDPVAKRDAWLAAWSGVPGWDTFRTGDWTAFEGRMQTLPFGSGEMFRVRAKQSWQWTILPRHLSEVASRSLTLIVCLDGSVEFRFEGGAPVFIGPGESLVLDTGRLWRLSASGPIDTLSLRLAPEAADGEMVTGRVGHPWILDKRAGIVALLHRLTVRTFDALARQEIPDAEAQALHSHLSRLAAEALAATPGERPPITAHAAKMMQRARLTVAQSAADPAFRPSALAARLGITPRYLTTLFQSEDTTPGGYIRRIRLHMAASRLTDPEDRSAIQTIGVDCGFPDAARFATAVSKAFGLSPRALRAASREAGDRTTSSI